MVLVFAVSALVTLVAFVFNGGPQYSNFKSKRHSFSERIFELNYFSGLVSILICFNFKF